MTLFPEEKTIYNCAINHYGSYNQQIKTIEECAELIHILAKKSNASVEFSHIIDELADVYIMINQMSLVYGRKDFESKVQQKLSRLSLRMGIEMAARKEEE